MAELLRETFNTPNSNLFVYNPNFVRLTGDQNSAHIENNTLHFDTGGLAYTNYFEYDPATVGDGGLISVDVSAISNTSGSWSLRFRAGEDNQYFLRWVYGELFFAKKINGAYAQVGSRTAAPTSIDQLTQLAFKINGTTLEAYWNDMQTPARTVTDNDFTLSGLKLAVDVTKSDLVFDNLVFDDGQAGAIPSGNLVIDSVDNITYQSASVNWSYDAADATSYEWRLDGGQTTVAQGSPIDLTGLAEQSTYLFEIRAVNQYGSTNWVSETITTPAAPVLPPQGTSTVNSVTPSYDSASVVFSYSDTDQTGFEARLNGGQEFSIANSPASITGLSQLTSYDIEIRAINASGEGLWSTPFNFTTNAAPSVPTLENTSDPLVNNSNTLWDNGTLDISIARSDAPLTQVLTKSGVSISPQGVFTVSDNSLIIGVEYVVTLVKDTKEVGVAKMVAQ